MTEEQTAAHRRRVKVVGLAGAAAFITLGVLSLGLGHQDATTGINLAGSGDAPANTTYSQPTEGAMTMGATATFTTPSSVEQSPSASPAVKAGG